MIIKKLSTRVNNIRQAAGTNGLPGNYIINQALDDKQQVKPECWYSSREIRNSLLGSGVSAVLPPFLLMGTTITFERLTVEQSDIDAAKAAGKDGFEYKIPSRKEPITYKQPGVHNINAQVDMQSLAVDKQMVIAELSMKYRQVRNVAPAPATTNGEEAETIIDETLETENKPETGENGGETILHENLHEEGITANDEKK